MTEMDYVIEYVEKKFGNGAVFDMLDYIEERKKDGQDLIEGEKSG